MKQAWSDLKSFVTVAMVLILLVIVVADLLGATLTDNILILVTNLITAVFTYYFTKKKDDVSNEVESNENIENDENNE